MFRLLELVDPTGRPPFLRSEGGGGGGQPVEFLFDLRAFLIVSTRSQGHATEYFFTTVDRYPYGSLLFLLVDLTSIASATIPLRISCCVVSFKILYFFPLLYPIFILQYSYNNE